MIDFWRILGGAGGRGRPPGSFQECKNLQELAQAFATQLDELKEAELKVQTLSSRVFHQFAVVQQAIEDMTMGTVPEVSMDWEELDELVKGVKKELDYVQGKVEDAQGEVEDAASYGSSAESTVEAASESLDDLNTNFTKLSEYVKEIEYER